VYFEIQARNPNSAQALTRLAAAIDRVQTAVKDHDAAAFTDLMSEGARKTSS
jgi:prephenate dehydrogenase